MSRVNEMIANASAYWNSDCTDAEIELISKYWMLDENFEFVNMPSKLKKEAKLIDIDLSSLIRIKSGLDFYVYCENCGSYEKNTATSQTAFRYDLSSSKYSFQCERCSTLKKEREARLHKELQEEYLKKFDTAIEERSWEDMSDFDKEVLSNCLNFKISEVKQIYWDRMGKRGYIELFKSIRHLGGKHLLEVHLDSGGRVLNYKYLDNLKEEFVYDIIEPEGGEDEDRYHDQRVDVANETNQLKFRLTVNSERRFPDSPIHSGTVIFPERIVIEPGVEYSFAQWERAHGNLYLVLTPTDQLGLLPSQRRMSDLPLSLRKRIQEFYDAYDLDSNF